MGSDPKKSQYPTLFDLFAEHQVFMSTHQNSPAAALTAPAPQDENQLIIERREKLKAMRQQQTEGKGVAFPNDIKPTHRAEALFAHYKDKTNEELEPLALKVHVAGRMMLKRVMGKASFATLQDASFGPSGGRIQLYINNEGVGEEVHGAFKHWDLGDIVAATGTLFKTRTGELSIHADSLRLVTKSLRPLPDKFHGMADQELKYRQRWKLPCCTRFRAEPTPSRSKPITTRWIRKCSCALRPSST